MSPRRSWFVGAVIGASLIVEILLLYLKTFRLLPAGGPEYWVQLEPDNPTLLPAATFIIACCGARDGRFRTRVASPRQQEARLLAATPR